MGKWITQIFVAISQMLNALTGGMADETLCSRIWRGNVAGYKSSKYLAKFFNTVFFLEENHCKDSYDAEVQRRHVNDIFKKI